MPWRPSSDTSLQRESHSSFWEAIRPIFDDAIPTEPFPRGGDYSTAFYVRQRKGDLLRDSRAMRSHLSKQFDNVNLGLTDIELIDFVFNYTKDRVLCLRGPRGAGKTSLLHFVESVITSQRDFSQFALVILNGLLLGNEAVGVEDFATLLLTELRQKRKACDNQLSDALDRTVAELDQSRTVAGVRQAVRTLAQHLPGGDTRQVTFVFDNLDQLSGDAVACALDLMREIYVASRIGVMVTLRPGSLVGAIDRGAARAFCNCELEVFPPSVEAFLSSLQPRIVAEVERFQERYGRLPIAYDQELQPQQIGEALSRFTGLLTRRYARPEHDVVRVLEAVSANDTRHLVLLVRRILSHRDLPGRWLLGIEKEEPVFYPLVSMIEGSQHLFKSGDKVPIPNLLYFDGGEGGAAFLLSHRILTLLSTRKYIDTSQLLNWLDECGYEQRDSASCLDMLRLTGLVGASDVEVIGGRRRWPTAYFLTEAGHYYLHHLLRYTDYLTSVVMDVPLVHRQLKGVPTWGTADTFAPRLDSLAEYAEEVRQREAEQIHRLQRQKPSSGLRRVASTLRKEGLLTASLLDGLRNVTERSRKSVSTQVQEASQALEPQIKGMEKWLASMEDRLAEIANRGLRVSRPSTEPIRRSERNMSAVLKQSSLGDDSQLGVEIYSETPLAAALVAVNSKATPHGLGQATVAVQSVGKQWRKGEDRSAILLKGDFREIPGESILSNEETSIQIVPVPDDRQRFALLEADDSTGKLRVCLHVVCGGKYSEWDLGCESEGSKIATEAGELLKFIGGLVTGGVPFDEQIRAAGVQLAQWVLSKEGQDRLASQYGLVDKVVIYSRHSSIPWEWLCPPPQGGQQLPLLSEVWQTIRWPDDHKWVKGLIRTIANQTEKLGSFCTVGLGADKPWRKETPSGMADLQRLLSGYGTLHLIGHQSKDGLLCLEKKLTVSPYLARAYPMPRGVKTIVLSACDAAARKENENLAIVLSNTSECVVWASLVTLTDDNAREVDEALATYCAAHPEGTFDEFMRATRSRLPLLSLYVRYGLH